MLPHSHQALFESVIQRAEQLTGFQQSEILGKEKRPELVKIRAAISMTLLNCHWKLKAIGSVLNRDHSTIIHHKSIYENYLFQFKYSGIKDSVIELTEILTRYAEASEHYKPGSIKANRVFEMKTMVRNGSSLLAALGVAA